MTHRWTWICLLLCLFLCSIARADPAPLPPALATPKSLGTHTIRAGEYKDFGDLRLWVGDGFVPQHVGSSHGRSELFLRGGILPLDNKGKIPASFKFNPESPAGFKDYTHSWISETSTQVHRLASYRWFLISRDLRSRTATIKLQKVGGGGPLSIKPRLKVGESRTLWLSTQGLLDVHLGSKRWDYADGVQIVLSVNPETGDRWCGGWGIHRTYNNLRPAAKTERLSYVSADVNIRALDPQANGYAHTIVAGDHTIKVLQVRLDDSARFEDWRCFSSKSEFPSIHIQLRITRNAKWVGSDMQSR